MLQSTVRRAAISLIMWSVACVLVGNALAVPMERVEFDSASQPLGSLQQRRFHERGEDPKDIPGDRIDGYLAKPAGNGPFPAMVALHGCGGLREAQRQRVADQLVAFGYVALVVDSFAARGIDHACTFEKSSTANVGKRVLDAFGALFFLARQPFVDAHRVGVLGFSQGGGTVLSVAEARSFEVVVNPNNLGFRAAVAFYPPCKRGSGRPDIPTLILIGALDDWAPAQDCSRRKASWVAGGADVELDIYPDAHHGFDISSLQPGRAMFGHWLEYNDAAANDANDRMKAFLARHLSR